MKTKGPPPTAEQRRLVDIGFVVQFYLAAAGHLLLWLYMLCILLFEDPSEGTMIVGIFVFPGIPISFAVLVIVYIGFRLLYRYCTFPTALTAMAVLNIVHSLLMLGVLVTPLRLVVPTILYIAACVSYCNRYPYAERLAYQYKQERGELIEPTEPSRESAE